MSLTPRQHEVLVEVAKGLTNKAIAKALGIRPYTVKQHLSLVMAEYHVHTRTELVTKALRAREIELRGCSLLDKLRQFEREFIGELEKELMKNTPSLEAVLLAREVRYHLSEIITKIMALEIDRGEV